MKKTMVERLNELEGNFWTRLDELVEDIAELGFEIDEANREYIVASTECNGEDVTYEIRLGGTERTITINSIEEIN